MVDTESEHEEYDLVDVEHAAQHFLLPKSKFSLGSSQVQVFPELLGPNMSYLSEVAGPEMCLLLAKMIRQMIFQILQALKALHSLGRSTKGKNPKAV